MSASVMQALVLPAELTIYAAAEQRAAWLGWLEGLASAGAESAEVRAEGVAEVDGAGLQLLLALRRSAQDRGLPLRLEAPSAALQAACAAAGLHGLTGGAAA